MERVPMLFPVGSFKDDRGILSFVNDFQLDEVKRFYHIEHTDESVVRAWQGHKQEQKWFYVLDGGFKIVLIKPDNWNNPSRDQKCFEFNLKSLVSVLYVPGGFINGFKATTPNSKMIVFSSFTIEQSKNDDYRFDKNKWHDF